MTQICKNRKEKKSYFKGKICREMCGRYLQERAQHIFLKVRVLLTEKKRTMSQKNTTNDDDYQCQSIVIGDILLHLGIKTTPIQVIVQSLTTKPSQGSNKPTIPRLGITNNETKISCDLKNSAQDKPKRKRTSKKIMHMHKAGWTLIKELRSKVITINHTDSNKPADLMDEQTQF
jgi:hypothetical protein